MLGLVKAQLKQSVRIWSNFNWLRTNLVFFGQFIFLFANKNLFFKDPLKPNPFTPLLTTVKPTLSHIAQFYKWVLPISWNSLRNNVNSSSIYKSVTLSQVTIDERAQVKFQSLNSFFIYRITMDEGKFFYLNPLC